MPKRAWIALQNEKADKLKEHVKNTPSLLKNTEYAKFQNQYRNDWIALIYDCIDWKNDGGLTNYQEQIIGDFQIYDRQAVRGPRGLGKTAMAALITLCWALVYDGEDWKVGTTASVWRQLEEYLWPEIHKWAARLKWDKIGRGPFNERTELLTLRLIGQHKSRAAAISSDDSETIEGLHAQYLKVIFDEAKIIPEATWDSLEGALSNAGKAGDVAKVLAISSPGAPAGRFYDIHKRKPGYEDWEPVHITMEQAINAGRMSAEWAEARFRQWGQDSALYQNQVLGNFAADDEDVIIPLAWVEAAHRRHDQWVADVKAGGQKGVVTSMGLDVALGTSKGDLPIFTLVYDESIVEIETFKTTTSDRQTMEIAGRAKALIARYNVPMYIDTISIGAGVYNRLREQGIKLATAFVASQKTSTRLKDETGEYTFRNKRAAMWVLGKEMLNPESDNNIGLPRNSDLTGELTRTRMKPILSNAVLQVESKLDIRKRIKRSTDRADSVLQALTGNKIVRKPKTKVYIIGQGYI